MKILPLTAVKVALSHFRTEAKRRKLGRDERRVRRILEVASK